VIDTQSGIPNSEFAAIMTAISAPLIALMVWAFAGKQLRRWWRRKKLHIPNEEENVRTISGPLWDINFVVGGSSARRRKPGSRIVFSHGSRWCRP